MLVRLVRHACATDKRDWPGDDADRPLDDLGRAQALAVADALAEAEPGRLRTSPAVRCRDTLVPLARRWSVPVEDEPVLCTGEDAEAVLALVVGARNGDVLCTHGEVLRPLLPLLGIEADDVAMAKGSWWDLDVEGCRVVARRQVVPFLG